MINYTKKTWVDYPNTSTPITASELNTREQAFYDLATQKLDISQAQGLTDTQKAQARTNISAESIADANQIKQDLTQLSDEVGINLWDGLMRNGHIDSTTHKYVSDSANAVSISYIPVIEGSTIYMQTSSFTAFGNYYWYFWDSNKNYISGGSSNHTSGTAISRSISVPSGVVFMTIQFNTTGVISDGTDVKVCINRSNPAINGTYYPFRGLRKQITEVSNETLDIKMLGWSVPKECPIQNYMDADRKFHQRVGRVDLGSLNWSYNSSYGLFYGALPTAKMGSGTASNVNGLCVKYELKYITSVAQLTDKTLAYGRTAFVGNDVTIKDSSYTTSSTFKQAMSGVYLYYELANEVVTSIDGNEATLPQGIDDASGLNLTSSYGTISNVHMVRIGKLCTIICQMSITSAISVGGILLSGLPTAVVTTPAIVKDSAWNHKQAMIIGGGIRLNEALNSGTMYINTTYITE